MRDSTLGTIGRPARRGAVARGPALVRRSRAALVMAAAACLAGASACGGGSESTAPGGPVAAVAVDPQSLTLVVGTSARLGAILHDAGGVLLRGRSVFWESENADIATVDQDGVVTGRNAGTVRIAANAEGKSGFADVTVAAGGPASVTVDPASATLLVGQNGTFKATVRDALGNVLSGAVLWSSDNSAVARVNADGVVTAISPGTAAIHASREGVSGTATVTVQLVPVARVVVSPATATVKRGNTRQFSATAYDAANNVLAGRTVTWTSSDTKIATVDSRTGLVKGIAVGVATITATVDGKSGTATVTVNN